MFDEWQGCRCVCGEFVVALHAECRAMMTPEEIREWSNR